MKVKTVWLQATSLCCMWERLTPMKWHVNWEFPCACSLLNTHGENEEVRISVYLQPNLPLSPLDPKCLEKVTFSKLDRSGGNDNGGLPFATGS